MKNGITHNIYLFPSGNRQSILRRSLNSGNLRKARKPRKQENVERWEFSAIERTEGTLRSA